MARKSQAELDATAAQHADGQAVLDAMGSGFSRKTFAPAPAAAPATDVSVFDDALMKEGEIGRQQGIPAPAAPDAYKNGDYYNGWEFAKDTIGSESLLTNFLMLAHESGFEADLKWSLPKEGSDEFKTLTEGLDPTEWSVYDKAVSSEHAQYLRFKVLEEKDRQQRMMAYGGVAGVLAANVLNPENVLLGMATGGFHWVSKGGRLTRALKNAGMVGAENVAIEAALFGMQETRDEWDILTGAVAGIGLGGALGALGRGLPDDIKAKAHEIAQRDLDLLAQREAVARGLMDDADIKIGDLKKIEAETRDAAAARRIALTEKAAGAVKRSELGALGREVGSLRKAAKRDAALLPEVEARMLKEDIASMGDELALGKQQTKMRKAAAKLEVDTRSAPTKDRLARAEAQHNEKIEAEASLKELRRVERRESKGLRDTRDFLDLLDDAGKTAYGERLTKARGDVAKALKLSRKAERGVLPGDAGRPAQAATFGADSASAARVGDEFDTEVRDFVPREIEPQQVFEATPSLTREVKVFGRRFHLGLPRFDMANVLRGIDNEVARGTAGMYVGDPVGAAKGLNPIGASEVASRLFDTVKARFHATYEPSYRAWLKEAKTLDGLSAWAAKSDRALRKEFGDAVDLALRTPNEPHTVAASKAAKTLSKLYLEFGKRAKDAGVKGFEHFKPDGTYAPRVFDWLRAGKLEDAYGTKHLEEFVTEAVRSGMRKAGVPMEANFEALAKLIGKGYYNTIRNKAVGIEPSAFNGVRLDDLDQIAKILELSGVNAVEKAEVLTRLSEQLKPREKEAGTVRYAKGRTILDEQFSARLWNSAEAKFEEKSFRDLFLQHDAEQMFENYARSMSGHIGLAEAAGVRSAEDHAKLIAKMSDLVPDAKQRARVIEVMDDAYKLITGAPLGDTSRWARSRRLGRALRDYNFARVMNQVGFAQIPDSAAFLTPKYFKYSKQYMPEVWSFMKRAQDGTLDHKFAQEVEELLATGTDYHNNNLFSAFDDEPMAAANRIEHGLRVAGRVTQSISGLRHMTDFNQRLAGMSAMNRIVSNIVGRDSDLTPAQMLNLGLTPEKIARIKVEADKHVAWDGKRKLMSLETGKWDDAAALNDLAAAAHREARRLVQEEDVGDTHALMHSNIGKLLLQFRRFPLVAYSKQLGHGLVHGDADTLIRTGLQVSLGSLSYAAQMYIYSLTKPADEQEEWRKKYLSPKAIFFGGIFRAGMFSIIPQALVAVGDGLTDNAMFGMDNARTTGLSSGLMGIPFIDLMSRTVQLTADVASSGMRGDREFDQSEFDNLRRLLPFQNALVVKSVLDLMQNMLPEDDDDDDDEETDWGLSDD